MDKEPTKTWDQELPDLDYRTSEHSGILDSINDCQEIWDDLHSIINITQAVLRVGQTYCPDEGPCRQALARQKTFTGINKYSKDTQTKKKKSFETFEGNYLYIKGQSSK